MLRGQYSHTLLTYLFLLQEEFFEERDDFYKTLFTRQLPTLEAELEKVGPHNETGHKIEELSKTAIADMLENDVMADSSHLDHRQFIQKLIETQLGELGGPSDAQLQADASEVTTFPPPSLHNRFLTFP